MDKTFPPRGYSDRTSPDTPQDAAWMSQDAIPSHWTYKPGHFAIGIRPEADTIPLDALTPRDLVGFGRQDGTPDDRHVVIVAGSRAGKTATVLQPNLSRYPGPCIVIDPKGELVATTAKDRERFGPVHVLDPFGVTDYPTSRHNMLEELSMASEEILAANTAQLAEALILETKEAHWSDAARNLLKGLTLHLLVTNPQASFRDLRALLNGSDENLVETFERMAAVEADGIANAVIANVGSAFGSMFQADDDGGRHHTRELGSILSIARQQTSIFDDLDIVTGGESDFTFADLSKGAITIYLVLPATRMGTHARWLRAFLMLALSSMEQRPRQSTQLPVWFVLEEFAALGHMTTIEAAAGYMAGFGVKLIVVLQDLTQLKRHYKESWETFLGNTGVLLAFGVFDQTTAKYLSEQLGQLQLSIARRRIIGSQASMSGASASHLEHLKEYLLSPAEIMQHFARETHRSLIITPGNAPLFLNRFPFPRR